jgi:gamma-glutamylputrescine oxidase
MLSYWEKESFFETADVVVIGSGIVGLNAAIRLKELDKTLRIMVVERGFLPHGASTRNAGFACFGSVSELIDDLRHSTESEVFGLVERRFRGLARLRERVGDKALRYEELGGFEIFKAAEKEDFDQCSERLDYFNQQVKSITKQANTYRILNKNEVQAFDFQNINNVIHNQAEGQIHTGEMMKRLLFLAQEKGVQIVNGLTLSHIEDDGNEVILHAADWFFKAKKVLVCTNGFARQLMPQLAVISARNQVILTEPIQNLHLKGCFHYDRGYFYFRNIDNRILLGGGRNLDYKTEETDRFGTTSIIQNALRDLLHSTILPQHPHVKIDMVWSGILGLGNVKKPIIEMTSQNIGVAVRMGGMGVAIGSLVGEEGAEMIFGD